MEFIAFRSIRKRLVLLVILSILPAFAILLYSGLEQRQNSIANARQDILILTHSMAEKQKEITHFTKQLLTTLSQLSVIQQLDTLESSEILRNVLKQNPQYYNLTLIDLKGNVLASGKGSSPVSISLADRKHFKDALAQKKFTIGEFSISRLGDKKIPIFPFAAPVLDKEGQPKAILSCVLKLTDFSKFHDLSNLPERSFVATTDHKGIRLFYYPPKKASNPVGKPIKTKSWDFANKADKPGIFTSTGSDGIKKIFAFEQVRLTSKERPYLYVWAGVPENNILEPANKTLIRNLLLMLLALGSAILTALTIGKRAIVTPIKSLINLTDKFSRGHLDARSDYKPRLDEFSTLTTAFHDMADTLKENHKTLSENEARFRHLLNKLDALVYVIEPNSQLVMFINEYGKKLFGDVTGTVCWKSIQQGLSEPCKFCPNKSTTDDKPSDAYAWEGKNNITGKWFQGYSRTINWTDGRKMVLLIATDITTRKEHELVKDALIEKLENALNEIKTLSGLLPICASCKKIRDDKGYWNTLEAYIEKHSDASFSHGMCQECSEKLYGDKDWYIEMKKKKGG